jgi:signal transduction histidine kinase/ActR/RegA family two-component response regulator
VVSGSSGRELTALGERVLVLAPVGRDAPLLCSVLGRAGLTAVACADMPDLLSHLHAGAGAVLLTQEALALAALSSLLAALSAQPAWAELPIVILCDGEPRVAAEAQAVAALRGAGNLTVLERPARSLTLVTAIQSALRARLRQYEIRDLVQRERAAREEAEAASKIKDEFLATVSHELRTPLGAILLWTRLLASGRLGEGKVTHALQAIERSAEAQSQLIEDLLDVSRMTSGKLRISLGDLELQPIIRAALDVIQPAAEAKRILLNVALDPRAGLVRADAGRIQQVVVNLLSNAVKFTPPGGLVTIRLWGGEGHLSIEVADTGKGIDRRFLPHVFERFRQADATMHRLQGGLGLGLSISRHLVELHGGTIRADSRGEGLGSVFTLELPLTVVASAAASPMVEGIAALGASVAAVASSLAGVRVLLVEDDPDTRDAMDYVLRQHGAEVTAVGSAPLALEVLASADRGQWPHVVLSDLGLPGMDGFELLRRIRALERARGAGAVPAAMLSAYARTDDRARALSAGFAAHLSKPVEPEQLVAVIEALAARTIALGARPESSWE